MSFVDRAIGALSPKRGVARTAARIRLGQLQSLERKIGELGYDGATKGRFGRLMPTGTTSANQELDGTLPILRARIRDAVQNDPYTAKAVSTIVAAAVGDRIAPQPKDERLAEAWDNWVRVCDSEGQTDFYSLQRLVARSVVTGGETFTLLGQAATRGGDVPIVPLRLRVLEGDHCDESMDANTETTRTLLGVTFDKSTGRRLFYWLYDSHPGDSYSYTNVTARRHDAANVIHTFECNRPGQVRGVPRGVSAIMSQKHLKDFLRADLIAKELGAHQVMIIEQDSPGSTDHLGSELVTDGTGTGEASLEEWKPGARIQLDDGQRAVFNTPPISSSFDPFVNTHDHRIAAAWGVTYSQMTGDLSGASYSTSRLGLLDFKAMTSLFQQDTLIARFCLPTWIEFNKQALAAGLTTEFEPDVEWSCPVVADADPLKSVMARKLEVRSGFKSHEQVCGELGNNLADVIESTQVRNEALDEAKIAFDTDGRRMTSAGVAQPSDPMSSRSDGRESDNTETEDDEDASDEEMRSVTRAFVSEIVEDLLAG